MKRFYYKAVSYPNLFMIGFISNEDTVVMIHVDELDVNLSDLKSYTDNHFSADSKVIRMNTDNFTHFGRHFISGDDEWFGFNSKYYCLPLITMTAAFVERNDELPSTEKIHEWHIWIWDDFHRGPNFFLKDDSIGRHALHLYRVSYAGQKHVDIGALNEKSNEDKWDKKDGRRKNRFSFNLNALLSYAGEDVIPSADYHAVLSSKEMALEVIRTLMMIRGSIFLMDQPEYQDALEVRDTLRQEYPFLTKSSEDPDYLEQLPRDATSPRYAGKIIRGEEESVLTDFPVISFDYPFPDGTTRNLLDHIERNESLNPRVIEFYRGVEGKDTRSKEQYEYVKNHTITGRSTINVPYMNSRGTASSAFITPTFGGSHGSVIRESYDKDPIRDADWFKSFEMMDMNNLTVTTDIREVIHLDFEAYYASLKIKLGIYETEGHDNYSEMRDSRNAMKAALTPDLYDKDRNEYEAVNRRQNAKKLILTSATGVSNTHNPKADLPLDNATMSMRSIGNILIYVLGQRFACQDALILSTNTDGLHIANISMDDARRTASEFSRDYGISIKPELVDRMVVKNSNERIEIEGNKFNVSGILKRSTGKRNDLSARISYPRCVGRAVLEYIYKDELWLMKEINRQRLIDSITRQYEQMKPMDWTVTLKGGVNRRIVERTSTEDVELDEVVRVVMTREGSDVLFIEHDEERKIPGLTGKVSYVQKKTDVEMIRQMKDIDMDAYVDWAYSILETWHNAYEIPELTVKPEIYSADEFFS